MVPRADVSEAPRAPDAAGRAARLVAPLLIGIAVLAAWEGAVRAWEVKHYVLPGPVLILETLAKDWQTLLPSLLNTMKTAIGAFVCAALGGLGIAILFARSRWLEASLFPYAVIVQVTPVVSIAPLIIIWVEDVEIALLICAWIVAFFPVVANTTLGLKARTTICSTCSSSTARAGARCCGGSACRARCRIICPRSGSPAGSR